jgi:outer membrane protein assembly factor BamD
MKIKLFIYSIFISSLVILYGKTSFAEVLLLKDDEYYREGMYNFVDRSYSEAARNFGEISKNYIYSSFLKKAYMMEVFCNFLDKEYAKIEGVVATFLLLFPQDENVPYMLYMKGLGHYYVIKDESRLINESKESLKIFKSIFTKYPNSIYAEPAKEKYNFLNHNIQLHELKMAEFEYNRGNIIAALVGYKRVLKESEDLNEDIKKRAELRIKSIIKSLGVNGA